MKKFFFLLFPFTLFAQSGQYLYAYLYSHYGVPIDSSGITFSFLKKDYSWQNTALAVVRLDKSRKVLDTLWFDYRKPAFRRSAFNPTELIPEATPKPRFSVGDSVAAVVYNQWHNVKILGISKNRYLVEHEKSLYTTGTRMWVDFDKVEEYVFAKKYR